MFKSRSYLILNKRLGFTLVELLIAIAIITVLVSLSAGAVFKFLSYQKQAATASTVDQVNAAIERVLRNIRTKAHLDYPTTPITSIVSSIGGNLQNANLIGIREPNRRDELVFVDLQIARSFPLKFSDIPASKIPFIFPDGSYRLIAFNAANSSNVNISFNNAIGASNLVTNLNVIPSIKQAFNSITGTPSTDIQNAACLLMALEANPDGLKGELLGTSVITDPDSKARYIATADGQPIGFRLRYLDSQAGGSKSVVGTVTVELLVP